MRHTLRDTLNPSFEPLPAQTAPPVEYGADPPAPARTAVIVCHGMGQQVRFQTLNDIVQVLRDEAGRRGEAVSDATARLVLLRDGAGVCTDQLGRVEIAIAGPRHEQRLVDLYEVYWAPLSEGRVVLRDVLWFLLIAGKDGIIAGLRGFRRLMFGRWIELPKARATSALFVYAVAVVASLVVINSALGLILAGKVFTGGITPGWQNPALVNALLRDILIAEIVGIPLAILSGLIHWHRTWFLRKYRLTGKRWTLPKWVEGLLVVWVHAALLTTIGVALAMAWHVYRFGNAAQGDAVVGWQFAIIAGLAFAISYVLRSFLIQYLGDVVVYLSGHAVSKFDEIRKSIQAVGIKVGRAVYGLPQYDRCVLVGHSLGSVVAYDLYSRILNEQDDTRGVQSRTRLFLTFGSPLDKTAFVFRTQGSKEADVREALVAGIQPMIAAETNRPAAWVNIWSPRDWISGEINYYEDPQKTFVINRIDPDASLPLLAHTHYWENPLLARCLYDAL